MTIKTIDISEIAAGTRNKYGEVRDTLSKLPAGKALEFPLPAGKTAAQMRVVVYANLARTLPGLHTAVRGGKLYVWREEKNGTNGTGGKK